MKWIRNEWRDEWYYMYGRTCGWIWDSGTDGWTEMGGRPGRWKESLLITLWYIVLLLLLLRYVLLGRVSCKLCAVRWVLYYELLWVVVSRYKFEYELKLMGHRRLVLLHGNLMILLQRLRVLFRDVRPIWGSGTNRCDEWRDRWTDGRVGVGVGGQRGKWLVHAHAWCECVECV